MTPTPPASVLLVRLSSIGDVIHTIPAYLALRESWPETRFGWIVETAAADLVRRLPDLEVHELDTQKWRRELPRLNALREMLTAIRHLRAARYEIALDFQGLLKSAVVARASGAHVLGFARGDLREPLAARFYHRRAQAVPAGPHIIGHNLHLAAAAGARTGTPRFPDLAGPEARRSVRAWLDSMGIPKYAIMHPTANWSSKRYPEARFVEAARHLHADTGLTFVWVWGPGEQEQTAALVAAAGAGSELAPRTTLPELAALIDGAELLIGGDSAPMHLATATGTPTVAVFGPTDPARFRPLDPADLTVYRELPCSHCHKRTCPLGTNECLESIPVETLIAAATTRLARGRGTAEPCG